MRINFNDVSVDANRIEDFERETGRKRENEPTCVSYFTRREPF